MHIPDMADDQIDKLTDDIATKLETFMTKIIKENNLCPVCAHSLIAMMCEKYIEGVREEQKENDTKH